MNREKLEEFLQNYKEDKLQLISEGKITPPGIDEIFRSAFELGYNYGNNIGYNEGWHDGRLRPFRHRY